MTRINLIPVELLLDQHLIAEYRELPMVHASLRRSLVAVDGRASKLKIPNSFRLNAGHVSFFYNKQPFLYARWLQLISELRKRGFQIDPASRNLDWSVFETVKQVSWQPSIRDKILSFERIVIRHGQKHQWYKYRGKPISADVYINKVLRTLANG